ncbi:MAG: DNA-3-methyladenine glycosylase I [Microbacteriaceae bacterium]|nr:DNA-3-methyladenine glycosylase I [Microbacteriaceae bacterium]
MAERLDGAPDPAALAAGELVVGDDGLVRPAWAAHDPLLRDYYDREWGRPVRDERGLFERISLEAFQSGLSWRTILAKRPAFRAAFAGFDPDAVAAFDAADEARLLADAGIVRNRAKIAATIGNARATVALRPAGGLVALVESFATAPPIAPRRAAEVPTRTAESAALAAALRARGFAFVGPTTAYALMTAIGLVDADLVGAHRRGARREAPA